MTDRTSTTDEVAARVASLEAERLRPVPPPPAGYRARDGPTAALLMSATDDDSEGD